MYLLLLSTFLSFLNANTHYFGVMVMRWMNKKSNQKETELLIQKGNYLNQQGQISVTDRFAQYSKLQRKINAIDQELLEMQQKKREKMLTSNFTFVYGGKLITSLVIFILSIYYRYTPVFLLPDKYDLFPFSFLISYPNDTNCVSFHFWVLCCTIVIKMRSKIFVAV